MAGAPSTRKLTLAVTCMALGLTACITRVEPLDDAGAPRASEATPPPTAAAPTTTVVAPPLAPAPANQAATQPPLPGLGPGARGPEVQTLEQRLADLRYDPGKVDGVFDSTTGHAVMAFQKVQGLARTGRATPDVVSALSTARPADAMLPGGGSDRVEIDLQRQVLFLWQSGSLTRVLPVSTGTGKRYCVDGQCAKAVTPGGSFRVTRKIAGLRVSRLGRLYNPLYFNGGIAIHGSTSVPGHPASHGCVRIPMSASQWFFHTVAAGTPVYVLGGPVAPVPFNEPTPGDATTGAPPVPPPPVDTSPPPSSTPPPPPSSPPPPPAGGLLGPLLG